MDEEYNTQQYTEQKGWDYEPMTDPTEYMARAKGKGKANKKKYIGGKSFQSLQIQQ